MKLTSQNPRDKYIVILKELARDMIFDKIEIAGSQGWGNTGLIGIASLLLK